MTDYNETILLMEELLNYHITSTIRLTEQKLPIGKAAECETITFTERGHKIIDEISDFAEQTKIFKDNEEKGKVFDGLTASQVFEHLLNRIINAPTSLHMYTSIILVMPFVRKKLKEEEKQ